MDKELLKFVLNSDEERETLFATTLILKTKQLANKELKDYIKSKNENFKNDPIGLANMMKTIETTHWYKEYLYDFASAFDVFFVSPIDEDIQIIIKNFEKEIKEITDFDKDKYVAKIIEQ